MQPQQQADTATHHAASHNDSGADTHHPAHDHTTADNTDGTPHDTARHAADTDGHRPRRRQLSEDAMPNPLDRREELCAWLRDNGIDPIEVPMDADLSIETDVAGQRWIRCDVYSTNERGERFLNVDYTDVARERVMAPLKTEPPTWWQPFTRPSREALLDALGAVRQIHSPVEHRGQTICGHCSAWDGPEYDSTDNSPVVYPCDTIKALRLLPSVNIPFEVIEPKEESCSTSSAT